MRTRESAFSFLETVAVLCVSLLLFGAGAAPAAGAGKGDYHHREQALCTRPALPDHEGQASPAMGG